VLLPLPDLPEDEALCKLWNAIFAASRADLPNSVSAWKKHDANLRGRADWPNGFFEAAWLGKTSGLIEGEGLSWKTG